jgi:hypothetical protein
MINSFIGFKKRDPDLKRKIFQIIALQATHTLDSSNNNHGLQLAVLIEV